jgi:hypothetical protein
MIYGSQLIHEEGKTKKREASQLVLPVRQDGRCCFYTRPESREKGEKPGIPRGGVRIEVSQGSSFWLHGTH